MKKIFQNDYNFFVPPIFMILDKGQKGKDFFPFIIWHICKKKCNQFRTCSCKKKIHTISYWIRSWWWMHLPTWMELGLFNIALMSTLLYYLFWGWVGDFWVYYYIYPYIDSQVSVHPYQASSITKVRTYNIISIWSGGHNHHQCHCYQKIVPVLWDSSFSHPWAK